MNRKPALYLILMMLTSVPLERIILGCNIPVFRYALERWEPSEYILDIYHESDFSREEEKLVSRLQENSRSGGGLLNILVNISKPDAVHFDPGLLPKLPGMVLYFPDDTARSNPIWAGDLDRGNIDRIIDSPARRRAREELQNGKTALFLVLSSSSGETDQEKKDFMEAVLDQAEKDIYITAPGTDIHGNPIRNPDFSHNDLSFTSVFIDRMDPEEEILARILLGTEQDLWNYDLPIAYPLFGRGRVLYALVGDGINKSMVYQACSAVTGWCSCTVKDDNPGTDLLLAADWTSGLGESWIETEELPQLTGAAAFAEAHAEDSDETPEFFSRERTASTQDLTESPMPETLENRQDTGRLFLLLMASLFVSIVVLSWILFRRNNN